jgi:integral membrane protein (TIGR01906 family)
MNILHRIASWIFVISIPVLLLSGTLAWAFNSAWIYNAGFDKYDPGQDLGLSKTELDRSARELIAYFNDPRQELLDINVIYDTGETAPLLSTDDALHMKDVKGVLWLDYTLFLGSAVYAGAYAISNLAWNRKNGRRLLASGLKTGAAATAGLLVFLGFFAVTSFDWFFTTFHEIFFPGGNWQFPPGDHMITLFPEGFWVDVTLLAGLVTLGLALAVWIGGFLWMRIIARKGPSQARP